jgi:hypothetical protein
MKKKLLPFILGCAMVAATPLAAHAELSDNTTVEYANEIPTSGNTPGGVVTDEGQNGFTEYNDQTSTENTLAKVFTNSTTSTGSGLGNTRNSASDMQDDTTGYPITRMNEQQDYRASDTPTTLAEDIADTNTAFADQENDAQGVTDLETSVPEFDMKIPASTVLPLGATYWRIGNVEIHGRYFVRPDKVDVVTTHADFHHSDWDEKQSSWNEAQKTAHSIAFTVADKRYDKTSIEGAHRYYFQDGSNKQTVFPYAYQAYTSQDYEDGLVSEINETHQVWVKTPTWSGKTAGIYTGSITFTASVVTTEPDTTAHTNEDMYVVYYPAEGLEIDMG